MALEAKRMFITEASEKPTRIGEQREDHLRRFLSSQNQNRLIPSVSPQKHIPGVELQLPFTLASCAVRTSKTSP